MRLIILTVLAVSSISAARAEQQPASIDIPAGAHLVFSAKAAGVQVYTCTNAHWVLKGPDAKLLDGHGKPIGVHVAGPTWRLNDGPIKTAITAAFRSTTVDWHHACA